MMMGQEPVNGGGSFERPAVFFGAAGGAIQ